MDTDSEASPELEAPSFGLLLAETTCWHCHQPTPAAALWVPEFTLDEGDGDRWSDAEPAVLHYIEALPAQATEQLREYAPWMQPARTIGADLTYWANHCTACNAVQGDHYLFGPDGPFFPQTDEELRRIRFVAADGALSCKARPASSSWMAQVGR